MCSHLINIYAATCNIDNISNIILQSKTFNNFYENMNAFFIYFIYYTSRVQTYKIGSIFQRYIITISTIIQDLQTSRRIYCILGNLLTILHCNYIS